MNVATVISPKALSCNLYLIVYFKINSQNAKVNYILHITWAGIQYLTSHQGKHERSLAVNRSSVCHVPLCASDLLGLPFLMCAQYVLLHCFVEGCTCPRGSIQYFPMNRKNVADIAKASGCHENEKCLVKHDYHYVLYKRLRYSHIDRNKGNCFSHLRFLF